MKHLLSISLFSIAVMFASNAFAEDVFVIMGTWHPSDWRSPGMAQAQGAKIMPSVNVNNGIMFMSFNSDISNLKVAVSTTKGDVVYEARVSGSNGLTLPVRLGLKTGSYLLTLSHPEIGAATEEVKADD